jgi:hypothetical protein
MTHSIAPNLVIALFVGLSLVAIASQASAQQTSRRDGAAQQTSSREAAIRTCQAVALARYRQPRSRRREEKNRHFAYLACMTGMGFTP